VPVVRPKVTESTALGAAYLAGLAVGYWKEPGEIASQWQVEQRFQPKMPRAEARALRERWSNAVERAMDWENR
jgi:glycerol kinase